MRQPLQTEYADIVWHRDHAATGWRSRAFVGEFNLLAYDDGRWALQSDQQTTASGRTVVGGNASPERAKELVYDCLVRRTYELYQRGVRVRQTP